MTMASSSEEVPTTLAGDRVSHFLASTSVTITSTTQQVEVTGNFVYGSNNTAQVAQVIWGTGFGPDSGTSANSTVTNSLGLESLTTDLTPGTQAFGSTTATFTGIAPGTYRIGFWAATSTANYFNFNGIADVSVIVSD